jgi:hypothetical protein
LAREIAGKTHATDTGVRRLDPDYAPIEVSKAIAAVGEAAPRAVLAV